MTLKIVVRSSHISTVSAAFDEKEEIRTRIATRNRAHFALHKILKSRIVSQSMKFRLYKTLIRPVMAYGGET